MATAFARAPGRTAGGARHRRARLQHNSVVVTGSNGKGSTAAMCASIGRAYGLRPGSLPRRILLRFNERIRIDEAEIGDDDFSRAEQRLEDRHRHYTERRGEKFGAFEALFALLPAFPGE